MSYVDTNADLCKRSNLSVTKTLMTLIKLNDKAQQYIKPQQQFLISVDLLLFRVKLYL